jgi:hypothetical protein
MLEVGGQMSKPSGLPDRDWRADPVDGLRPMMLQMRRTLSQ